MLNRTEKIEVGKKLLLQYRLERDRQETEDDCSEVSFPSRPDTPENQDSRFVLLELLLSKKQEELENTKQELRVWKAALAEKEDSTTVELQNLAREKDFLLELLLKERLLNKHLYRRIVELESECLETSRTDVRRHCHEEILLRKEIERLEVYGSPLIEGGRKPALVAKSDSDSTVICTEDSSVNIQELKTKVDALSVQLEEAHKIIDIQHTKLVSRSRPVEEVNGNIKDVLESLKSIPESDVSNRVIRLEELLQEQTLIIEKQQGQLSSLEAVNKEIKGLLVASCVHKDHPSQLVLKYNDALLEIERLKRKVI